MPRILHLLPSFLPGGIEMRLVTLMGALGDRWEHRIAPLDDNCSAAEAIPGGIDYRIVVGPRTKKTRRVLRWTFRTLKEQQPDLVLTYNWGSFDTLLGVRLKGLRAHIHHEDGFNQDEAGGEIQRRARMRRLLLKRTPRVVVPSTGLQRLAKESWGIREERLSLVPNGVDVDTFRPLGESARLEMRAELGTPPEARVVLSVAGLREVKRLDRLIDAAQEVGELGAPLELWLVGDGPERQALEERARQVPPERATVRFLGFRQDLPRVMAGADLFCLSSDSEQAPVSLLEAMAAGLPAVCTDVGDCSAALGPLAPGALVPPGPEAAAGLGSSITTLLRDEDERARRARLGRERMIAEFSLAQMVATHERLWLEALGQGPRTRPA